MDKEGGKEGEGRSRKEEGSQWVGVVEEEMKDDDDAMNEEKGFRR